ncbi:hypothetical protein PQ455_14340 [Sphingomonas naphthae]|uniref:Uncharacterized protein n=1 Tax=Sphingomonas naphthae TaxID=1813468 RepID=A0ABY7TJ29_9SPHN|nr:hypothetical protein [Sphingomonas naphthae]WCT72806.1 hypothetical protein PQ455_14340 [Sphingomonas naphthae]
MKIPPGGATKVYALSVPPSIVPIFVRSPTGALMPPMNPPVALVTEKKAVFPELVVWRAAPVCDVIDPKLLRRALARVSVLPVVPGVRTIAPFGPLSEASRSTAMVALVKLTVSPPVVTPVHRVMPNGPGFGVQAAYPAVDMDASANAKTLAVERAKPVSNFIFPPVARKRVCKDFGASQVVGGVPDCGKSRTVIVNRGRERAIPLVNISQTTFR